MDKACCSGKHKQNDVICQKVRNCLTFSWIFILSWQSFSNRSFSLKSISPCISSLHRLRSQFSFLFFAAACVLMRTSAYTCTHTCKHLPTKNQPELVLLFCVRSMFHLSRDLFNSSQPCTIRMYERVSEYQQIGKSLTKRYPVWLISFSWGIFKVESKQCGELLAWKWPVKKAS